MTKNPDDVFADLHERLATELLARLSGGECKACGRKAVTVQELEAIRKFLADNGVTDGLRPKTPLRSLVDAMPFGNEDPEGNIDRPASRLG